jgi:hypothetical protein
MEERLVLTLYGAHPIFDFSKKNFSSTCDDTTTAQEVS